MPFAAQEWAGLSLDPHANPCCDRLKGLLQEMPAIQPPRTYQGAGILAIFNIK